MKRLSPILLLFTTLHTVLATTENSTISAASSPSLEGGVEAEETSSVSDHKSLHHCANIDILTILTGIVKANASNLGS